MALLSIINAASGPAASEDKHEILRSRAREVIETLIAGYPAAQAGTGHCIQATIPVNRNSLHVELCPSPEDEQHLRVYAWLNDEHGKEIRGCGFSGRLPYDAAAIREKLDDAMQKRDYAAQKLNYARSDRRAGRRIRDSFLQS